MRVIVIATLVVLVIGVVVAALAMQTGLLSLSATPVYPQAQSLDISTQELSNSVPQFPEDFGGDSRLDLNVYGVNGVTAGEVTSWYRTQLANQGWELNNSNYYSGSNWESYVNGWVKGEQGTAMIVWSGPAVQARSGYDAIILTATAPVEVWEEILE